MASPEFLRALEQRFIEATPHIKLCGMQIVAAQAEHVQIRLPYRDDWLGDAERGFIHPGIVTVLVDSASGAAVLARIGQAEPIATLDLRMDYLRVGVRDADIFCRAECFRLTANIAFVRASVWQHNADEPIAVCQSVFMRTQKPVAGVSA
ncbi:PaaI family thioesterase [Sinimarinibacterium sp. NLF-5-8]|nr:PaaI family thioesterase [Sinimarinibacterium sp. NLF-5-8]